jgi:16S rRNA (adenine1518-N6/adenine1519-N6)-dimethyltransferase
VSGGELLPPPDPGDLADPRQLLRRFGLRPRKGLGQHFLIDRRYLATILAAAEVHPDDVVLEIGPGLGVLTQALAARAGRVIAVELDPAMRLVLAETVGEHRHVQVVAADILAVDPGHLAGVPADEDGTKRGYKVVANLPYYITSAVLRHVLEASARPERMVVMVQQEVAARILAQPGDMSVLAISVQLYAIPSHVATVPARAFYPAPKVDSAIVRLDVRDNPAVPLPPGGTTAFFRVVKAGFGQKRKQLKNSLAAGLALPMSDVLAALASAGIDPRRRAETLSLAEWSVLARTMGQDGIGLAAGDHAPGHGRSATPTSVLPDF